VKVSLRNLGPGALCPRGYLKPPLAWRECVIEIEGERFAGWDPSPRKAWKHAWWSYRVLRPLIPGFQGRQ
jgi:hypothetical protein